MTAAAVPKARSFGSDLPVICPMKPLRDGPERIGRPVMSDGSDESRLRCLRMLKFCSVFFANPGICQVSVNST